MGREIKYPLTWRGEPATARETRVFKWNRSLYIVDVYKGYGWLTPSQTLAARYGICIDTACLCVSLFTLLNLEAYVALGA